MKNGSEKMMNKKKCQPLSRSLMTSSFSIAEKIEWNAFSLKKKKSDDLKWMMELTAEFSPWISMLLILCLILLQHRLISPICETEMKFQLTFMVVVMWYCQITRNSRAFQVVLVGFGVDFW